MMAKSGLSQHRCLFYHKSLMVHILASLLCSSDPVAAVHHMKREPYQYVSQRDESRPLTITNQCPEMIYPGIATSAGTPPSVQGFALDVGDTMSLTVGADWQGRVWGRTNCSFNSDGSGPSNAGGNNGGGNACTTGDCNGVLNCVVTVSVMWSQFIRSS